MKKTNNYLFLLATLLIVGFSACKKNDSTEERVLGKWFVEKREIKTTRDGRSSVYDYPVTPADYFSFKKDNTFLRSFDGVVSSGSYLILGDNLLKINNDTAIISKITKNELNFNIKALGVDAIMETELNLTK